MSLILFTGSILEIMIRPALIDSREETSIVVMLQTSAPFPVERFVPITAWLLARILIQNGSAFTWGLYGGYLQRQHRQSWCSNSMQVWKCIQQGQSMEQSSAQVICRHNLQSDRKYCTVPPQQFIRGGEWQSNQELSITIPFGPEPP